MRTTLPKLTHGWKWNVDDIVPDEAVAYNAEIGATAWVEKLDNELVLVVGNGEGECVGCLSLANIKALFKHQTQNEAAAGLDE